MKFIIEKCPLCGRDYSFKVICNYPNKDLCFLILKCTFCEEFIFQITDINGNILYYFPTNTILKFPPSFKKISPIGIEIYRQALESKEHGLDYLVGMGLRKALEHIVTDYLIIVQEILKEDLKLNLAKKIELLDKNLYATAAAHIVRILGNDFTHCENKHNAQDDELIKLIETIAILMSSRYDAIQAEKRLLELSTNT